MPLDLVSILQYGVLGLCAYMVWHVGKTISAEQKRLGQPRFRILRAAYVFMAFCVILSVLNAYVQLTEKHVLAESDRAVRRQHEETVEQLNGVIKNQEKKIAEQADDFSERLKSSAANGSQNSREIDRLTYGVSAAEQRLAELKRENHEMATELTALKDGNDALAVELKHARERLANREMVIRSVAAKFFPLSQMEKTANTETSLILMSSAIVGIASDLRAFRQQKDSEDIMPTFEPVAKAVVDSEKPK